MKVLGLDGKEYKWNLISSCSKSSKRSNLHKRAKIVLENKFPHDTILEEISLPGSSDSHRGGTLRADFFLPSRSIIVEVHGQQHFKFNSFHFKNKLQFYRAIARDKDKQEWCRVNDISLVCFNFDESDEEWSNKI